MKNIKWIYILIATVVIIAAIAVSLYYYFFIYLKSNFSDLSQNYISSATDDTIKPGDKITYIINFNNTGNRTVDTLEIKVKLPAGTSFHSSESNTLFGDENNILIFKIENLKKDEGGIAGFTVITDNPLDNGTPIILENVEFKHMIGDKPFIQDIIPEPNHTITSSPDLNNFSLKAVDKNGGYLQMGDTVEYTLSVENKGDMNAAGVEVTSMLSESISIIEGSISSPGSYKNNTVTWDIDSIEAGRKHTFKFEAAVNDDLADGDLIEVNSILTSAPGIKVEKSSSDPVSLFSDLSSSEIFISDANGDSLWAGEIVNIKIVIRNTGEKQAKNYSLICPTPGNTVYISRSGTPEGISWNDEIRGLVWDLADLEAGQQKEINFQVKVNDVLYYTGGTVATDFRIESNGQNIVLEQVGLRVSKHIYMTIVAMGDSLIERSDWVQRFDQHLESTYPLADYNTIPSGVGGEMSFQGVARFDATVAAYGPQIVIIAYGTNDVGISLSYFSASLESLILKSKNIGATVFVNLLGPISREGKEAWPKYNDSIIKMAAKHGVPVIDVLTPLSKNKGKYLNDGMHYSSAGAAVVAQTVYDHVIQYLDSSGQRR